MKHSLALASLSALLTTALSPGAVAPAHAQADASGIASVDVTVQTREGRSFSDAEDAAFALGEQVVICFVPSRDGFVTVWAKDENTPGVSLIYPNQFASAERRGIPVVAGEETCIGKPGDDFVLRARPPAGISEIAVAWTASEEDQLTQEDFSNPSSHAGAIAIGTVRFAIVE